MPFRFVTGAKQYVSFLVDVSVPSWDASKLHLLYPMYNVQYLPIVRAPSFLQFVRYGSDVLVPPDCNILYVHQYFYGDLP